MKKTIAVMMALLILPVPCLAGNIMKCGGRVVTIGDSTTEVLAKCGPPAARQSEGLERSSLRSRPGGGSQVVRTMETWVYNFGKNRAMRMLTFEGDKLTRIELGSYGYEQ